MTALPNTLTCSETIRPNLAWSGKEETIEYEESSIRDRLLALEQPCFIIKTKKGIGVSGEGTIQGEFSDKSDHRLLCFIPALTAKNLGDEGFKNSYKTPYAYYTGSMAHGISSVDMVMSLGKQGFLSSFGAGGVIPAKLEEAINQIQGELPEGPYAFNLIHNPFFEALERNSVETYLKYGITTVEASAYMDLTPYVVLYRVAGLSEAPDGSVLKKNRIIAKISRREVATKFMEPPPEKILAKLLEQKLITQEQANMAKQVPMADDVTVEADSGGHTDNRPLVSILPSMIALRNEIQSRYNYDQPIRIGAAGGIATPESALAAFMMGASYVVTGSVNQACIEAGTSPAVQNLLAQTQMADVVMAPAFDMFEMGGRLQVLKRGTLFAMRAQKLADFYHNYRSIEEIPVAEKEKLEKQVFRKSLEEIWQGTVEFFNQRDPEQIEKANKNPRKKMALVFRWYLGLASHWANSGEKGREMDYQIWCGPSMGAFNDWVRGSYLEEVGNRKVVDVAKNILDGAAYLYRIQQLKMRNIHLPVFFSQYTPRPIKSISM
ncbi:PfaD family polyunsaturated fatty acid/polyketide biosynthesis protein [bacterium]|nr:PfaD family polyunsaturated fatty acid/polyketide biosynthesis protein [bacterium]